MRATKFLRAFLIGILGLWQGSWADVPEISKPKTVLYLAGGPYAPWYSLGVLYAVRDYHMPVDSVVGTSWGALVGSLWSKGFELDEIQRFLLDPLFTAELSPKNSEPGFDLPIAKSGKPSLAFRFAFFGDSTGNAHFRPKKLDPDSLSLKSALLRLRISEMLERTGARRVPFTALSCERGVLKPSSEMETLPFAETSGENCPSFLPGDSSALNVYVAAFPLRAGDAKFPRAAEASLAAELEWIQNEKDLDPEKKLVVIRPHSFQELSPQALMQAGYSDFERRRGELLSAAPADSLPADSIFPRFRIEPSFEKLPAAYYQNAASFWNPADTGIDAPTLFLKRISRSPFYDSVTAVVDSLGVAEIGASVSPLLEFRVGGVGSNLTGPMLYAGVDFRYIDQYEYLFRLDGFYGEHSYGFRPQFRLDGMLGGRASLGISGKVTKRTPLRGYFSDADPELRILEVKENDALFEFGLKNSLANLTVGILVGESEFKTFATEASESGEALHVNYLEPNLSLVRSQDGGQKWFGDRGYRIEGNFGLRSINLTADGTGSAPLYFSLSMDLQKNFAPLSIVALGLGANAGVHIRRESGYGYEYPAALESWPGEPEAAIDNWFRFHPALSPWSESWNFAETASHHYALVRASAGLHKGIFGAWIFGAYMRDFEENPYLDLDADRLLLEPTLRVAYRSIDVRAGMSRLVSMSDVESLLHVRHFRYFFAVGSDF